MTVNKEVDERKAEICTLESRLRKYSSLSNTNDSEKRTLSKKLEETQSKYNFVQSELTTANKALEETRLSLKELTDSNKQLRDKVVNTLRAYRTKCHKHEESIRSYEEQCKLKEIDLTKAVSHAKELEIKNLKQRQELEELLSRMEDLQQNVTLYANKCQQVSDEKSKLEISLSQSNEKQNEHSAVQRELQHTKDENSMIKSELIEERQKRIEYESLCNKYYENNLLLKEDKALLQLEVEKETLLLQEERTKHTEAIRPLEAECTLSKQEIENLRQSSEELIGKLKRSIENSNAIEKKSQDLKLALEEQKAHTNNQVLKSKTLIRKLRTLSNENLLMRNEFQQEKESFELRLKSLESSELENSQHHTVLQKRITNAQMDSTVDKENLKNVIEAITRDIDNLLKLLCNEGENVSIFKGIPAIPQCNVKVEIEELRERLQSCFTVTGTLKNGYNKLKLLVRKGRDTIKSNHKDIQHLQESNKEDVLKYQQDVLKYQQHTSELERTQERNQVDLLKLQNEIRDLQYKVENHPMILEECVAALTSSVDILKEEKLTFNVLHGSRSNQERQDKIDRNITRITTEIEKLTKDKAKQCCDLRCSSCSLK